MIVALCLHDLCWFVLCRCFVRVLCVRDKASCWLNVIKHKTAFDSCVLAHFSPCEIGLEFVTSAWQQQQCLASPEAHTCHRHTQIDAHPLLNNSAHGLKQPDSVSKLRM